MGGWGYPHDGRSETGRDGNFGETTMTDLERWRRDQAMCEDYNAGASLRRIGTRYGLSPQAVANALRKHETALRGRGRASNAPK